VYNRYNQWAKTGLWRKFSIFFKKDGNHEWHMIDRTIIRAYRHFAGALGGQNKQKLGHSCGGFSSKIHAKVGAFRISLSIIITAIQAAGTLNKGRLY
jgi:hypothetical protein